MTLTSHDIQSLKQALQPEFDKVSKKIESLRRSNRKDHNLIIDIFDKRDLKLQNRVSALENKSTLPPFKNL